MYHSRLRKPLPDSQRARSRARTRSARADDRSDRSSVRSRSPARSPSLGSASLAGPMADSCTRSMVRCVDGSKVRRLSTSSPNSSIRMGRRTLGGQTSMMPPRRLNWPGASTTVVLS